MIRVNTERSFGNSAQDESLILPPVVHNPKGPMLPLYTGRKDNNAKSTSVSPFSQSDVKQHSHNSSLSRIKQDTMSFRSRAITPAELDLQLDLPMVDVNTAKPTLHTGRLSHAPRSAVASMISPFPVASILPANTSPTKQFTAAFGRPKRNARFGPRSKNGVVPLTTFPIVVPLSILSVESPPTMSKTSASRFRKHSTRSIEARRPPRLDLTSIPLTVPVRPLPTITAEVERSPTPPMPISLQEEPISHSTPRALCQFRRNSPGSSSSNDPDDGGRGKVLPGIPQKHGDTSEEDNADSEHSFSRSIVTHGQDMQSRRVTEASIWSQESPTSASYGHAPDMKALLAQLLGRGRS